MSRTEDRSAPAHTHIDAKHRLLDLRLGEVWRYRDLIRLFTKRNFAVQYKQTILGPLWLFLSPLLSSFVYMVVFGRIARLGTDGVPQFLFYLCGTAVWGFFASCLTGNSDTFSTNAALFGKVYFPRLTVPISNVLVALARFGIQMLPVLAMVFYYTAAGVLHPVWRDWLLLPLVLLQLGMLGMGFGILFSSLTTKYRDLSVLIKFGTGLWMYATPVVYPLSELHLGKIMTFVRLNPVTMPVELFRRALFGVGTVEPGCLWLSVGVTAAVALLGVVLFSRVERTFMDTI